MRGKVLSSFTLSLAHFFICLSEPRSPRQQLQQLGSGEKERGREERRGGEKERGKERRSGREGRKKQRGERRRKKKGKRERRER